MKPKDIFLNNIQARIKVLQNAYDYNKDLPDDVFELLLSETSHSKELAVTTVPLNGNTEKEYGVNKRLVREILEAEINGISKKEIINKFAAMRPNGGNISSIVTNAISALNKDGAIEKRKPRKKMRGFNWKIKSEK